MNLVAILMVAALYLLHQDVWLWQTARPLVFGFLPIGLAYHAAFTLVTSLALLALVRLTWPTHLDDDGQGDRQRPTQAPRPRA